MTSADIEQQMFLLKIAVTMFFAFVVVMFIIMLPLGLPDNSYRTFYVCNGLLHPATQTQIVSRGGNGVVVTSVPFGRELCTSFETIKVH